MVGERDAKLLDILRAAAWEADRRELGAVSRETPLDQLELDSVSFMQVIAHFEDTLERRLPHLHIERPDEPPAAEDTQAERERVKVAS